MKIKYFDNAATTQVNEEVLKEMLPYFSIDYGNPSSLYSIGRRAKRALEESRKKISNIIGCKPNEVYFTSCGTESDNLAIKGIAYANKEKGNHIITSKIEHPAVLNTCKELEKEGYKFTSDSDCEILLPLYEKYKEEMFKKNSHILSEEEKLKYINIYCSNKLKKIIVEK